MRQFVGSLTASEGGLVPALLVAVTDTRYMTPLVSPRMVQDVGPDEVHVFVGRAAALADAV